MLAICPQSDVVFRSTPRISNSVTTNLENIFGKDVRAMLTVRKYLWFALIAAVSVWILYVAWNSASFQACIANKQSQQSQENLSELLRFFEIKARVGTDCFFVFLYDSRDAVTAVATAFIAIFTLTLWWATWGLLTHGREIERAYVSGGGPHDLATRIFQRCGALDPR